MKISWTKLVEKFGLTAREAMVAELIATGISDKEIALQLDSSTSNIKFHNTNIYRKLGMQTGDTSHKRVKAALILRGVIDDTKPAPTNEDSGRDLRDNDGRGYQAVLGPGEQELPISPSQTLYNNR